MPLRKVSIKPSPPKAMTSLPAATSNLKEELLKWICERHATNGPLDRQLLRDKALGLATSLGVTGFKCSEAWLTLFLKKHGFSPSLTNCNGPTFPDYRVWIDLLRSLITQYRHKDLFNVDELRMYSDFVPARISPASLQVRDRHGGVFEGAPETTVVRSPKTNRVGMLVCCNSSGTEKLRPLISGPYEVEDSGRDFRYHRDEDSSITDDLFGEWLAALNADMSGAGRKILLLLSRERIRSLHKTPRLSNVNLLFFPKDFPTQLRPLRGDVFHSVKMTHRSRYAERIRSADGEWRPEEIVRSLARAWTEVPQELVVSSFQRTKFREDGTSLRIECAAWDCLGTGVSFRRFVTFDDDLSETSSAIPEDLKLSAGNGHQYNLRRSRRDTVDLVVIDEDSTNAGRGKKASKRSAEETGSRPVAASNGHRSSSGLRKKRKMTEEIAGDCQDGQPESRASVSSDETRNQSLVERIEDFLDGVAVPSVGDNLVNDSLTETSGFQRNDENVDDLINGICERSDKTRGLMERCLCAITAGDGASGLADEDARPGRSPEGHSTETSGLQKNDENVDDLITAICQRSDKTGSLMERCLCTTTAGDGASGLADEDARPGRSPEGDSTKTSVLQKNDENVDDLITAICQRSDKTGSLMERCLCTITAGDGASGLADEDARPGRSPEGHSTETSGLQKNDENVDDLINGICQRSDKTGSLMERCLCTITAGDGASGLADEDARLGRSPEGHSTEEVDSVPGETGRGGESPTGRAEETARNSAENSEAGTSGEEPTAEDTSGLENPPVVAEFDDGDEEIPIAGRLSLKIIEAIECCDEIERSNDVDINHLQAGDEVNDPRSAKRTRDIAEENDEDDGPAKKRARPEGSWSKRYEKNFVFGPELRDSASQSVESSLDEPPAQSHGPATRSKKTQTRGGELEKRCIFTLDGDSPGVSYPKD